MGHWYALYSRPRSEKKLAAALEQKGFEVYLPLLTIRRKWSDRIKVLEIPAFPSYVFVYAELPKDGLSIKKIPYCVNIVHTAGLPAEIDRADLELLKLAITEFADGLVVRDTANYAVGDKVRLKLGPFAGREAVVEQIQGHTHMLIHFPALNKTIQIRIPVEHVEAAGERLLQKS